jgi:hypothetical protein
VMKYLNGTSSFGPYLGGLIRNVLFMVIVIVILQLARTLGSQLLVTWCNVGLAVFLGIQFDKRLSVGPHLTVNTLQPVR